MNKFSKRAAASLGAILVATLLGGCSGLSMGRDAGPPDHLTGKTATITEIGARLLTANYPQCAETNSPMAEARSARPAVCGVTFRVVDSAEVNARAIGQRIELTTGMLAFIRSEDELAFVTAHEIAHVALGHSPFGISYRGRTALETEADDAAVLLTSRAGFDPRRAAELLRRMEDLYAGEDRLSGTHLSFHQRYRRVLVGVENRNPQMARRRE